MRLDASKLDQFRGYIAAMKHSQFSIPAEMSEVRSCLSPVCSTRSLRVFAHMRALCDQVIQSDFVERRQASQGGEAMTQDDLLFRMTAARCVFHSLAVCLGRSSAVQLADQELYMCVRVCVCACPSSQASRLVVRRD